MDAHKTIVIFRKYEEDIIAFFPYEMYSANEHGLCMCYMHLGQHSSADYPYCVRTTKLATPEEYAPLKTELESIGYNLTIRKRK